MPTIPDDYLSRCYAGVLGKIIGVYMGRPFEGWTYQKITDVFGPEGVTYYVNQLPAYLKERPKGHPLVVTDDDISGTFGFFRALEDLNFDPDLSAEQIGRAWLNYIIEKKTILWWGGMGLSTEHTAYLRLKHGIAAPASGSIAMNGPVVAEQIGAQIFIDAWGFCAPGTPALAAKLARAAGSVSHDGEAVHGAVVIAAIEAEAFVNPGLDHCLDTALSFIPADCLIARLIADIRAWAKIDGNWRHTRQRIEEKYGYDKYGGNCHIIPNHALVILALVYAPDSFAKAQNIVNTCGWDTDCNAANVGAIQGVRLGLDAINRDFDYRGPVADRLFLPTAEGGRAITDALTQTFHIARAAHKLAGGEFAPPKVARYTFALPGSVQGFMPLDAAATAVENASAPAALGAGRALRIKLSSLSETPAGVAVSTFFTPDNMNMEGYALIGSPTLFPGQQGTARLLSQAGGIRARLAADYYGDNDASATIAGEWTTLAENRPATLAWKVPATAGRPIYQLRLEFAGTGAATVFVDTVDVTGTPSAALLQFPVTGSAWAKAWASALDAFPSPWPYGQYDRALLIQNEGLGNASIGGESWSNYRFEATLTPHLAACYGIAVAYRGLTRYISLCHHNDGTIKLEQRDFGPPRTLASAAAPFELYKQRHFAVTWTGGTVRCAFDGRDLFGEVTLDNVPSGGGVALLAAEGRVFAHGAEITSVT